MYILIVVLMTTNLPNIEINVCFLEDVFCHSVHCNKQVNECEYANVNKNECYC
ncbi:hypothetical protein P879_11308 [Paragonimus westermani]|uniref:Uncharacterized protein n=1 Tax=Paragonimus westermani TaxID=34504 RepID=A0A8T0DM44_9TREM|nr:hypothetical protein P879_11308 [Paragonimus westermani]